MDGRVVRGVGEEKSRGVRDEVGEDNRAVRVEMKVKR